MICSSFGLDDLGKSFLPVFAFVLDYFLCNGFFLVVLRLKNGELFKV